MPTFSHLLSSSLQRTSFKPLDIDVADSVLNEDQRHTAHLKSFLGEEWKSILTSISPLRNEADLARITSFGANITQFTTSFLCAEEKKKDLAQLGSLFNLIAALYDFYLDHPVEGERFMLDRNVLLRAVRSEQSAEEEMATLMQTATLRERVMMRLILRYLQELRALTARDVPVHYMRTFEKMIVLMFDAQNATVNANAHISARLVMRKSALSIVALGFPVWLTGVKNPSCTYFAHLRWMYRLGDFISWVDDFADFEEDRDAQRPNRLLADAVYPYERALRVSETAQKIMWFRENLTGADEGSVEINKLFTKYIYNWLKS